MRRQPSLPACPLNILATPDPWHDMWICCRAYGDREARCDDAVGAKNANRGIGDVHGTTASAIRPAISAHQLCKHPNRVETLGEAMSVSSMG